MDGDRVVRASRTAFVRLAVQAVCAKPKKARATAGVLDLRFGASPAKVHQMKQRFSSVLIRHFARRGDACASDACLQRWRWNWLPPSPVHRWSLRAVQGLPQTDASLQRAARRLSGKLMCLRCISRSTVMGRNPGDARNRRAVRISQQPHKCQLRVPAESGYMIQTTSSCV